MYLAPVIELAREPLVQSREGILSLLALRVMRVRAIGSPEKSGYVINTILMSVALFQLVDSIWGPHTVDRFASFYNAQVPLFKSTKFHRNFQGRKFTLQVLESGVRGG